MDTGVTLLKHTLPGTINNRWPVRYKALHLTFIPGSQRDITDDLHGGLCTSPEETEFYSGRMTSPGGPGSVLSALIAPICISGQSCFEFYRKLSGYADLYKNAISWPQRLWLKFRRTGNLLNQNFMHGLPVQSILWKTVSIQTWRGDWDSLIELTLITIAKYLPPQPKFRSKWKFIRIWVFTQRKPINLNLKKNPFVRT